MNITGLNDFHLPRWNELSDLGLYLDQVQIVLDSVLRPVTPGSGGNITGTMITNYVKQKVVPQTEKKKYYRRHLAQLIVVFLLKHTLSTAEINMVLAELGDGREPDEAYDMFCREFESRLGAKRENEDASHLSPCPDMTAAAVDALAGKLRFEMLAFEKTLDNE